MVYEKTKYNFQGIYYKNVMKLSGRVRETYIEKNVILLTFTMKISFGLIDIKTNLLIR